MSRWFITGSLILCFLGALLLTVLPEAHHECHHEADSSEHVCLVTLLAQGQTDTGALPVITVVFESAPQVQTLVESFVFLPVSDVRLLPGRAPPVVA